MLREEELSVSPNYNYNNDSRDIIKQNGFSFIQNRVPSPLNNNFLLSAEQSRHIQQPSEDGMNINNNVN